ncbi:hypothetical protein HELRODRAFT_167747 [Helobdella robusta]|uniref:Uncharacterized protein n=1 Tax=Helobdella robusta TaxID=6412 RepID=T1EZQ9_HELRO|nr:hypothetical protein HELRODRAFT_167747 [Helobdella robusta]ESO09922.1 hypothetical protein HELRODRAFT_167747 [Helobdella robusta]
MVFHIQAQKSEGSTLFWSQEITAVLHNLIYKIKSNKPKNYVIRMLDVPCGDMMWMKSWNFYEKDIVKVEKLEFYDIILCRMLLQHLYDGDNLSGSNFFITTTYPTEAFNMELGLHLPEFTGRYKRMNLELPPFSLVAPICICRDGPTYYGRELNAHYVAVWRLPLLTVKNCQLGYSSTFDIGGFNILYNSCSQKYSV